MNSEEMVEFLSKHQEAVATIVEKAKDGSPLPEVMGAIQGASLAIFVAAQHIVQDDNPIAGTSPLGQLSDAILLVMALLGKTHADHLDS